MKLVAKVKRACDRITAPLRPESVRHDGAVLPARRFRFCGREFRDDAYFLASARREANRLVEWCGLGPGSRVLDIGCGPGRLAIGILDRVGEIAAYRGVDVDRRSVRWGNRHLGAIHPTFRFEWIDVRNERYNPGGVAVGDGFRLPFQDGAFDIVYLYSVFSHMIERDVRAYARESARLLTPGGSLFLTGFLEDDVPPVSVNPPGYRMRWQGALHCVRYQRRHFESLLNACGFRVRRFEYETETDGQSALLAKRTRA